MILTGKAREDFRNWLREKYEIRYHEFEEMPDAGKLGYYIEYFSVNHVEWLWRIVKINGEQYNINHEKEN